MSNLAETSGEQATFETGGLWSAYSFTTGSSTSTLADVIIAGLDGYSGADEFISIYSNSASNEPDTEFATFSDNPVSISGTSNSRLIPNGTVELAASTQYWLVFGTDENSGEFSADWTSSANETGLAGWSIGDNALSPPANPGESWRSGFGTAQFEVRIVPEPSEYAFAIGLGLIAFVAFRRMQFAR